MDSRFFRNGLGAIFAIVGIMSLGSGAWADERPDLKDVGNWAYQLQNVSVDRVAASGFDLIVVDYSKDGSGAKAFTADEVARMQKKPDGGRRLVIAYFSIGEAESYRYYWKPAWKTAPPGWLRRENPDWEGNYLVDYADPRWKRIVFDYLDRILEAGFDGIYLDKVDSYLDLKSRGPAPMRTFVKQIAEHARTARPGFIVIAQNAENLLANADYRSVIDAIGREDLYWNQEARGKPTPAKSRAWASRHLDMLKADGKPVFVVDYVTGPAVADVYRDARGRGYIPYVTRVELDRLTVNEGLDPAPGQ